MMCKITRCLKSSCVLAHWILYPHFFLRLSHFRGKIAAAANENHEFTTVNALYMMYVKVFVFSSTKQIISIMVSGTIF